MRKHHMRKPLFLAFVVAFGLAVPGTAVDAGQGTKIKKCKDAEGKWHYGDRAAEECARAKVIELSGQGVKTKVIRPPATDEELEERARLQAEEQEARKRAEEQARRDRQLLGTYGHEDDIKYIRDRKLAQIEATIAATTLTLKPMRAALARIEAEAASGKASKEIAEQIAQTKAQITRHDAAIAAKRQEQEVIRNQADADLKRYRELKRRQTLGGAAQTQNP